MAHSIRSASETQTRRLAADLAQRLSEGDVVLLSGPLGAGKTTFVRGFLEGLGFRGAVRSPSFNLVQSFPTTPRVMHADLYRVDSVDNLGLEDYLDSHICLIEWPEKAPEFVQALKCWRVQIASDGENRTVQISSPGED